MIHLSGFTITSEGQYSYFSDFLRNPLDVTEHKSQDRGLAHNVNEKTMTNFYLSLSAVLFKEEMLSNLPQQKQTTMIQSIPNRQNQVLSYMLLFASSSFTPQIYITIGKKRQSECNSSLLSLHLFNASLLNESINFFKKKLYCLQTFEQ